MADVFSVVVNPLVDEIIKDANLLLKQNYKLLKGVEEDVKKLTSILTSIQAELQDAEDKQLESPSLRDWLGKLKEIVYDSEDVLQTLETEALLWQRKRKVRVFKPTIFSSSKVANEINGALAIKEILRRLYAIEKEKEVFHLNVNVEIRTSDNRITSPVVHKPDIVGRENDKNSIIDMLLSEESDKEGEISVIPIIGMGGVGKTTLAQLVFNDDQVKKRYPVMMWVCVTDNYDHRKICKDMIEFHSKMKFDDSSLSENQVESRLLEILKREEFVEKNRFLLVLDDVWNDSFDVWKKLETILKQGVKGSKVLVTSRNTRVSEVMGTEPSYPLKYMNEDDCWLLFEKITFNQSRIASSVRRELEDIGKQIVEKCKGLPLAVRAMAGLLRGVNDVKKWRRILEHEIWEAEEYNTGTGKPIILPALRLSYDHLPSDLKQCFVYCSLFPKAYVFHKTELIKLWKSESLIRPRPTYKPDDTGGEYFDELVSRSLFQLQNVDNRLTYRMHDLIHDLARSVSSPYFYQIKDNSDQCMMPDKVRHLSLLCKDAPQSIMDQLGEFKKLRTLLSPVEYSRDFRPALEKLFHTWKYVRTLDLSSSMITELPESVGELKLLNFLDLSKTEIRKLPNSLCKLYNLQTLKLLGCLWLFELPKDFGNLSNLEHLELEDMFWQKSLTLPSNIGSLKNLQNLHVFRLGQKRGYGIEELKNLLNLKGSLHISRLENARKTGEASLKDKESLVKVTFEWSSSVGTPQDEVKHREMIEDLQPHPNVEEIQILRYQGERLPSWLRGSGVEKLTTLSLKHCSNCKILSLGQLPNLQKLCLKGLVNLEEWSDAHYHNLHRLKISNCPKLKQVPSNFPSLGVLKITKCDLLEALPVTPSLMFLILVDNLLLKDFSERFAFLEPPNDKGQCTITDSSFLRVLEMKIINCPKMQQLPQIFAPQKLDISGCPLFTALPTSDFSVRLQHLAIDACDGRLVTSISDTISLYSLVISNIKNLNSLPKLSHLPGLKALYIHGCKDLVSLSDAEEPFSGLNSLQLLSIRGCPKLETLTENTLPSSLTCLIIGSCSSLKTIGPKDVLKKLNSLKDLYIEHCKDLEALPEEGVPTSLQHFRIEGCPLLMSRCQDSRPDWPKIMNIPDLEL